MVPSPRSPTSGRSTAQGFTEAQVALRLTQFLDEWHFCMVNTCMSKNWDRKQAVKLAIEVLECNGAVFPDDHFKDEILELEEEAMVGKLVETLPIDIWESLDEILGELMQALDVSTRIRAALDGAPDARPVHEIIEETQDSFTTKMLMRSSIRQASSQVLKTRKCNASWAKATEDRIDRLMRSAEDSDAAMRNLLVVEAQLAELGGTQKARSKGFLAAFVDGKKESVKIMTLAAWRGVVERAKNDGGVRAKFQERLDAADKKLYEYKQQQLLNVRNVLQRQVMGDDEAVQSQCFGAWLKAVEDSKRERAEAQKVEDARSKLGSLQLEQAASAKKVLLAMSAGKPEILMSTALQGWLMYMAEAKKEKEFEEQVQKGAAAMKEKMKAQKDETKAIVQKMIMGNDENLLSAAFSGWCDVCQEDIKQREVTGKIEALNASYKATATRHTANAFGVQGKTNEMMAMNWCQVVFCNWLLVSKVDSVENHFNRKLESKRRQLAGVQNLFRTFAKQLETGLGDGDLSSRQNSDRDFRPLRKVGRGESAKGGMVRGGDGSVSLPDIHQGHRHAWA
eukprot:TRINITY_DN5604_c0_g1_i1.p1 TRINITY_DN5604_c0_g1~~TRINITY_DN5604_c0_g1_i1.p1  ORF type:complete len:566 (-),score=161.19 TRINITY_DN5604_c0_g1_i1:169-1866(-)